MRVCVYAWYPTHQYLQSTFNLSSQAVLTTYFCKLLLYTMSAHPLCAPCQALCPGESRVSAALQPQQSLLIRFFSLISTQARASNYCRLQHQSKLPQTGQIPNDANHKSFPRKKGIYLVLECFILRNFIWEPDNSNEFRMWPNFEGFLEIFWNLMCKSTI